MNIALYKDGTYGFFKKEKDFLKKLHSMKYAAIDNSTPLKGPVYTIVEPNTIIAKDDIVHVDINISYSPIDVPCCADFLLSNSISIRNIDNRYSVFPLIKQIAEVNTFKDTHLSISDCIEIDSIFVTTSNNKTIDLSSMSDKQTNKFFKAHNMYTIADTMLDRLNDEVSHIILSETSWFIADKIPKRFKYILVKVPGSSTLYFLSYKKYLRFMMIDELRIGIIDHTLHEEFSDDVDTLLKDLDLGDDTFCYDIESNSINIRSFSGLVEVFLYYPQIMLLESMLYKSKHELMIELSLKNGRDYNLHILDREIKNSISLFKVINKLIQM